MKYIQLILLMLFSFILSTDKAVSNIVEQFKLSPLCTVGGEIICPDSYVAACADEVLGDTIPKCILFNNKYIPGCWKFTGHKNIDFSLIPSESFPSAMVKITSAGDVYTLNRDIIGCKEQ